MRRQNGEVRESNHIVMVTLWRHAITWFKGHRIVISKQTVVVKQKTCTRCACLCDNVLESSLRLCKKWWIVEEVIVKSKSINCVFTLYILWYTYSLYTVNIGSCFKNRFLEPSLGDLS